MTQIRQIVKDAFKCDNLYNQFTRNDCEDGVLLEGTMQEVNEKFTDAYIIKEAEWHLYVCKEWLEEGPEGEDFKRLRREYNQLTRFLKKYRG